MTNNRRFVIRIKRNRQSVRLVTLVAFLLVVCLPFHTVSVFGIGLLMLLGVPLLLLSFPTLLSRLRRTFWDRATVFLACYFGYNLLAFAWTPVFSANSVYTCVKVIIVVMCLYCQTYNSKEKKLLLWGSLISCVIVCWFMLTETNVGYESKRLTIAIFGVVQDPNYLGYLFLIPAAISLYQFSLRQNLTWRILWAVLAGVILLCVLTTGSRGALLGVAAVVLTITLRRYRKFGSKLLFCLIMGLIISQFYFFVMSLLPEHIAARYSLKLIADTGGTGRWKIWMDAVQTMAKQPYKLLFGFGTGSSRALIGWATHNFLLQILLELGIVGTVLFSSFFWIWFKRLSVQDPVCFAPFMGCMALAMTLSVNTNYYFWVTFILSIVCSKARQEPGGGYF